MHPGEQQQGEQLPGITAVLASDDGRELEGAVLDLAAVLDGLVDGNFEIIVVDVGAPPHVEDALAELRVRYPSLRSRLHARSAVGQPTALATGFDAATYDLILAIGTNGEVDVRETNHLLEAIEHGADLVIGFRPRRADGLDRRLYGWGWNALLGLLFGRTARDVNCPFKLFRTAVWQQVHVQHRDASLAFNAKLLVSARQLGFQVAEVPVSHRRPRRGTASRAVGPTEIGRALVELSRLSRAVGTQHAALRPWSPGANSRFASSMPGAAREPRPAPERRFLTPDS